MKKITEKFIVIMFLLIVIILLYSLTYKGYKKNTDFQPKDEQNIVEKHNYFDTAKSLYDRGLYYDAEIAFNHINKDDTNYISAQEYIKKCKEKLDKEYKETIQRKIKENQMFLKTKAGKCYKFCESKGVQLSKEDCEKAVNGEIWIGMNIYLLIYKRGNPDHINPSNYGRGTSYQYCWFNWTPSCFYDNDGDDLIDAYN